MVVNKNEFCVHCNGDLAAKMAACKKGQALQVTGKLSRHVWKTTDKIEQERFIVVASHIRPVRPPRQKDLL